MRNGFLSSRQFEYDKSRAGFHIVPPKGKRMKMNFGNLISVEHLQVAVLRHGLDLGGCFVCRSLSYGEGALLSCNGLLEAVGS